MKKTLVSALTTALVVGAASTTFAAANPFEDVPADHWAYDAVAQLAADGVIEGYGDGTYRGDQEITRYEMAQMVARAMAKGGGDKALIDKLAAEFADELNNLGVRVSALEKKVDNVKWGGKIRYRYSHRTEEWDKDRGNKPNDRTNVNQLLLRFEPQMKINEHWTGKARLDYQHSNNMHDAKNEDKVTVDRIYIQGDYKNLKILLGKLPYKTQSDYGLIMDRYFSGGSVTFGSNVKVALNIGRANDEDDKLINFGASNATSPLGTALYRGDVNERTGAITDGSDAASTYGSIEVYGDRSKAFTWGLGWHRFGNRDLENGLANRAGTLKLNNDGTITDRVNVGYGIDRDNYNVLAVGLGYKFKNDLSLTGAYAHAFGIDENQNMKDAHVSWNGAQSNSYSIELAYKGANAKKPGSWGAFIAYRQLGTFSSTGWNTYRLNGPQDSGTKGWEIGVSWAPMKNVTGIVRYFSGKEMNILDGEGAARNAAGGDYKVNAIFTEWNFLF